MGFVFSIIPNKTTVLVMIHSLPSGFIRFQEKPSSNNQPGIVKPRIMLVDSTLILLVLNSQLISAEPLNHTVDFDHVDRRIVAVNGKQAFLAALILYFRGVTNRLSISGCLFIRVMIKLLQR
jgi:hypothetical protein